jgi:hypothetical protein
LKYSQQIHHIQPPVLQTGGPERNNPMSIVRVGSTQKFSDNWENIFSGKKAKPAEKATAKKAKKKAAKPKAAKKKAKG